MNFLTAYLDKAKKELLDFGLRNQLINFRLPKSRGIELDDYPSYLFHLIIDENKAAVIKQKDADDEPSATAKTGIQTSYKEDVLVNRLKKTTRDAKSHIEERGINILFMALGMLEWCEENAPEQVYKAPLILIPVKIETSKDKKSYLLSSLDEEFQDNISLKEKLRLEFGIKLPDVSQDDAAFDLEKYFDSVKSAISKKDDWVVDSDAAFVSFFNFNKFVMYVDLDEAKWLSEGSPEWPTLIKHLLDSNDKFRESNDFISDEANLDEHVDATEQTCVLDSDSSQSKAIIDVRQGRNLVIQGPPGTGKSQTITNIIADALRHNKKVLFVAEKIAALQVVHKRLKDVNLADACIELHSFNANKKSLLDELARVLRLSKPNASVADTHVQDLLKLTKELNDYSNANNTPVQPCGFTPHVLSAYLDESNDALSKVIVPTEVNNVSKSHSEGLAKITATNFKKVKSDIQTFQIELEKIGSIEKHPLYGVKVTNILPSDLDEVAQLLKDCISKINIYESNLHSFTKQITEDADLNIKEAKSIAAFIDAAPDLLNVNLDLSRWSQNKKQILQSIEDIKNLVAIKAANPHFLESAWEQNLLAQRQTLNTKGHSFFSILSSEYRNAKSDVQKIYSDKPSKNLTELIQAVDSIERAKKVSTSIKAVDSFMTEFFANKWQQASSNTVTLDEIANFVFSLTDSNSTEKILNVTTNLLKNNPNKAELLDRLTKTESSLTDASSAVEKVCEKLVIEPSMFKTDEGLSLVLAKDKLIKIQENFSTIQQWIKFTNFVENLNLQGLGWAYEVAKAWPEGAAYLDSYFTRQVMETNLRIAYAARPILEKFDVDSHEALINKFTIIDPLLQHYRQSEIALRHYNTVVNTRNASLGQIGIIKEQIEKKRKFPIRKLFEKAGNAIQEIKPVFMMSPLSVASFIPPKSMNFDLVVFDEASQVKPVDAFGAILRGNQVVVVGDSKQMPPTNFFESQLNEDIDDDDDDLEIDSSAPATSDIESILSLMVSQNAPERMLKWHYRSQYKSLISVSNYEFYDSELKIFPSASENQNGNGLIFRFIENGTFDRGGSKTNQVEAKEVAKAVLNHARNHSEQTLGVVAFSISQREAIEDQLELLAKTNPVLSQYMEMHGNEKMFVKNLENIQGDERDVIFISIGYGKTKEGFMAMTFGPLNKEGGERRLNVLISRARQRCEVFSSITAEDIDLDRTKARGVVALKTFLKYAKDRILDTIDVKNGAEYDSIFEEQVAKVIKQNGYEVDNQVGSAGFKIDLAVKDPDNAGAYLLAIECDGATYHSSKSARERDRLRQEVLEARGWKFYRIWSTSWLRQKDAEINKLLSAIKAAEKSPQQKKERKAPKITIEREVDTSIDLNSNNTQAEWVEPYKTAQLSVKTNGTDLYKVSPSKIVEWIKSVVEVESPIHIDLVARRITHAAGLTRVGNRIEDAINKAARQGHSRGDFILVNRTVLKSNDPNLIKVRDRSNSDVYTKDPELITPEEIVSAAKLRCMGAIKPLYTELIPLISKDFGYQRTTEGMYKLFQTSIEKAIKDGKWAKN